MNSQQSQSVKSLLTVSVFSFLSILILYFQGPECMIDCVNPSALGRDHDTIIGRGLFALLKEMCHLHPTGVSLCFFHLSLLYFDS